MELRQLQCFAVLAEVLHFGRAARRLHVVQPAVSRQIRGDLQPGCIVHSDRGGEYTAQDFKVKITEFGYRQSMGRTGSCSDNAVAESHWAVIKTEIGTGDRPDRAAARADLFEYIEVFYNRQRLRRYPDWGHLTPLEARQRYHQGHVLAA